MTKTAQPRWRPHFGAEEVGASDGTPMGLQERVPRRRPLRDRWKARCFQDATDRGAPDTMPEVLLYTLPVGLRTITTRHLRVETP